MLQYKNAWPFRISWVILDQFRTCNSRDDFPNCKAVRRKLIISMLGDSHLGGRDKPPDLVNRAAQQRAPSIVSF
jgi:hypothetical protein